MIVNTLRLTIVLILSVPIMIMMGCASHLNLVQESKYFIQELNSDGIKIKIKEIYVDDGAFIVSGKLKRLHPSRSYPGHVDVAIISPNGAVFDRVSVKNKLPFIGRSKRRNSSFKAQFIKIPPEGSTVRVNFHMGSSSGRGQFDCGADVAKIKGNSN